MMTIKKTCFVFISAVLLAAVMSSGAMADASSDDIEAKVRDIVAAMTLDEKIEQMAGKVTFPYVMKRLFDEDFPDTWINPGNDRLGVPQLDCIDGPRGVGTGRATCFPVSMARGAAWDPVLEQRIGEVMGYEARALGANMVLGPCVNLLWHPRWGRAQETYGEDPWLLGMMGAANVRGLQKYVMSSPKHFAANNIEKSRFYVDVRMDERTLREVYLPHFKMCVDAGASSVMSAYNDLNGYLCAHNRHLMRDILKDEWGFQGFVISDWIMAVSDPVDAALSGLDMEMPIGFNFGKSLKRAVKSGKVPEEVIDEAVSRIIREKLIYSAPQYVSGYSYDAGMVASSEHTDLALEAARKGIVLLKNSNKALPIKREKVKTVALIGRLATSANIGDKGSSAVNPPFVVTPLDGLRSRAGETVDIIYSSGRSIADAGRAAGKADVAVVIAGYTFKEEGEQGDRKSLELGKKDEDLIKAVCDENSRCIVVLIGGSAITMQEWKDDADAIVMAWYPGMMGGYAIADVLFGDFNPCGKLPITFPESEDQLYAFNNRSKSVEIDYYHGYRYFDRKDMEPEFPFGYGLSYTKYEYNNLRLDRKKIGKTGSVNVKVDVRNTGDMAGQEIVQLYVGFMNSSVSRPEKELKAFGRLDLKPGEKKTISLNVKASDLAYYNTSKEKWEIEEMEYSVLVGPSSRNKDLLKDSFRISGI